MTDRPLCAHEICRDADEPIPGPESGQAPAPPARFRLLSLLGAVFLLPIRIYQGYVSPLMPAVCRFEPSCSTYFIRAVKKHGVVKGSLLGFWRILRCSPLTQGGYDPVP